MTERHIIMPDHDVRAILEGRKTQMRRIITHRHGIHFLGGVDQEDDPECWGWSFDGPDHSGYMVVARGLNERHNNGCVSLPCPYGEVGDRLWVRETWCQANPEYPFVGSTAGRPSGPRGERCYYRATDPDVEGDDGRSPWRSPIHMPRWASRITLEIADVRVQRLQDISEEDARAEGLHWWSKDGQLRKWGLGQRHRSGELDFVEEWADMAHSHTEAFERLWDSLNAKRAPWASNPWVWAISFQRVDTKGAP